MANATLPMAKINSWDDFHEASRKAFGFPEFYGNNNNAWIDCLRYLDDGMSAFDLHPEELLDVLLKDFRGFSKKHPEFALDIIQLFAFMNSDYIERGISPRLRLTLT